MSITTGKYWALLAGVAALQTGFLGKMAYDHVSLIAHGREITLNVIPVDPRDVFRGEYVVLGYDISQLKSGIGAAAPLDSLDRGQTIYATLQQGADGVWAGKGLSLTYPTGIGANEVVLKGLVRNRFVSAGGRDETVSVRYGIESYFVPEGTGRLLEQMVRDEAVETIVAVGADGTAAIKGLIVKGERREDPPLY